MTSATVVAGPPAVVSHVIAGPITTVTGGTGSAALWTGEGPPGTVVGAHVGDEYLDTLTGTLYRLDEGA